MKKLAQKFRNLRTKPDLTATPATVVPVKSSNASPSESMSIPNIPPHEDYHSGLERLPPEVRRHLLSILDLSRLKALVRASPTFHEQYLLDRRYLLSASIDVTLRSVGIDAYFVYKSANQASTTQAHLVGLLKIWQEQLSQRSAWQPNATVTEDEAIQMVSLHFQTIVPIARHFAKWALDNLAMHTKGAENLSSPDKLEPEPELSDTEWLRCVRAVYRFQLLCNVTNPALSALGPGNIKKNAKSLFYALEPWEVEELFSFYQFTIAVYDKVFNDIRDELKPDNPRFDDQDRAPTPEGAFELDNEWNRKTFLEGTILRGGLSLLYTILFDIKVEPEDRERLVTIMQRSIVKSFIPINSVDGILGEMEQDQRRRENPSAGDQMTEERAPFPFSRDDLGGPPLAWTLIWGGTYSNLYGWYTADEMRRWAYIFWDSERLEKHGGKELLLKQWEEYWDDDPRENL